MIDPDGAAVAGMDLPSADPLPERLIVVTRRAGAYRIDVSIMQYAFDKDRVADSYTLRVLAAQPATGR